jgi:hypothetical protein
MAAPGEPAEILRAPMWKRVLAPLLDFIMVFAIGGQAIGALTAGLTPDGFDLQGGSALALLVVIVAYFIIGRRFAGGTMWDRFFGIARPQPTS